MKKIGKTLLIGFIALLFIVLLYVAYVFLSYHRIPDQQTLTVESASTPAQQTALTVGEEYSAITYNIGFGAYTPDFSFFMDGGTASWAKDKPSVIDAVTGSANLIATEQPTFALLQEVDIDGTRSHHVNQYDILTQQLPQYSHTFAINYDSAFLFYPLHQPHGKNKAGMATYSTVPITSAVRRSLPISTSFSKFLDLDRAYSVNRIPTSNGKELILYNVHLSAYGNDASVRTAQLTMLHEDMNAEYEKGNYIVVGGDFNHDLKADENSQEEVASWSHPFPRSMLADHFYLGIDTLSNSQKADMWNTSRNANKPYDPATTDVVTLDGFIFSDNIEVVDYHTIQANYQYSDHEPVKSTFILLP